MGEEEDMQYGKALEYEPEFQGPRRYRKCTDVGCIYFFGIFMVIWIAIGIFAYIKGDTGTIFDTNSAAGYTCGKDQEVLHKKYVLYTDLLKCSNSILGCSSTKVCVAECPTEYFTFQHVGNDYQRALCDHGYNPKNNDEAAKYIKKGYCAGYYFPSKPVFGKCIPTRVNFPNMVDYLMGKTNKSNKTITTDLKKSKASLEMTAASEKTSEEVLSDLKHGSGYIVAGIVIAILATIVYIGVMRWIAKFMVWLSLVVVGLAFLAATIGMFYLYSTYKPKTSDEDASTAILIGAILFAIIFVVYCVVLFCLRKRIKLAIALIKESSKAIGDMVSSLFFPIIPSIVQILILGFGIGVAIYLSTIGDPYYKTKNFNSFDCKCSGAAIGYGNNTECVPDIFDANCFRDPLTKVPCRASCEYAGVKQSVIIYILHGFNIFGTYWGLFFIYAFVEMVLAGAFASWYWTMPKSNLESFPVSSSLSRAFRYHLGTIAFGSLIITIIRMIRLILDAIQDSLKKSDNAAAKILVACLECLFDWLERIMKFINRNAYILTAVHGYNFCKGAKEAFSLIMRNIVRVYVLDKVSGFLLGLSKLLITIGVASIGYVMIECISSHKYEYPWLLIIIIAAFTLLVTTIFFNVFEMAIDTLFICYLEDSERNDGSAERPFFMSHKLSKIFAKEE